MMSLYKTRVRPHVEYCSSAWSPLYKKDKELIEKVQHTIKMDGKLYKNRACGLSRREEIDMI